MNEKLTQKQLEAIWLNQNTLEGKVAFKTVNELANEFSKILNKPIFTGEVKVMTDSKTGKKRFYY